MEYTNIFHALSTKLGIKDSKKHRVMKYNCGLHRYIQIEMDFLNIATLPNAFKYASKIEEKFKQRGRRENPMNNKWKGEGNKPMGKQIAKEPSPNSPTKKTWGVKKIGQESGMWCEVHKSPSHNTKDCRTIKNLMMESHEESIEPEMIEVGKQEDEQIIEAEPYATMATAKVFSRDDEERLFHSQMWVGGKALHFIVDSGSQKNLISFETIKRLNLETTSHPQPYSMRWVSQGKDIQVNNQC